VPPHLRDAHYRSAGSIGHGEGYVYPHDLPGAWAEQQYRPDELVDHRYYEPSDRGHEAVVAERLKHQRGDHGSDAGAPPAPGPEGERRGHGDETGDAATRAE
jgi:putative ATPase